MDPHPSLAESADAEPDVPAAPSGSPARRSRWGRGTVAGMPWSRRDLGVGAAVGLAVAITAYLLRVEIVPSDPWHYVMAGVQFPQHTWNALGYTRYGMILPILPIAAVWGVSQATFYAMPLLGAWLLGTSLYLVGRRWWGAVGGVVAVVAALTSWLVFVSLSRYYPDLISSTYVLVALVFALEVRGRQGRGAARTVPFLLLTGFFLGWAAESRETAVFGWIVVAVVLWVPGHVVRNALWTALPVLGWGVLDLVISAVAYGDPLLKLHTFTHQDLSQSQIPADEAVLPQYVGRPRLDYLAMIPRQLLGLGPGHGVPGGAWVVFLGVVALLGLVLRDAATRLAATGFAVTYFLFVGIAGFFDPSHPAGVMGDARYWAPFLLWLALAVAGVVSVVARRLTRGMARPALAAGVAGSLLGALVLAGPTVVLVGEVRTSPLFPANGGTALAQVRGYLSAHDEPGTTVWSDGSTERLLRIYVRGPWGGPDLWSMPVENLLKSKVGPRSGDLVVWTTPRHAACTFCARRIEAYAVHHPRPPSWKPVFRASGGTVTVYRVGSGS